MKKLLLVLLCVSISFVQLSAQGTSEFKHHELYLSSNSILGSNLGFHYKTSIKDKLYLRIGVCDLNARQLKNVPGPSLTSSFSNSNFLANGQIQIGLEKRIEINDKAHFYYGLDIIENVRFDISKTDNPNIPLEMQKTSAIRSTSGIGAAFGLLLNIKNKLYFSAEVEPSFNYRLSIDGITQDDYTNKQHSFYLDTNSQLVKIALMYQLK